MNFLENVRVVEVSHMVMGPSTGVILGDLGAHVVKVEPLGGDKTRRLQGSGAGYFSMFNRNKKSICLDLLHATGQMIMRRLLETSDVFIENFRPGALDTYRLGYDEVNQINPNIIYQSSKGFLSGPYAQRTALDEVAQMMGGLAYMTGPAGRPLRAGSSVVDITGGMFGVIGILAALLKREQSGQGGAHISSSLFESVLFLVGQHIAQHAATGTAPDPMPARVSAWAIYDVFDTRDGQVFVAVVSDRQWSAFCEFFGFTDWLSDPNLVSNSERVARRDEILPIVRSRFCQMTVAELTSRLTAAKLPFAPINRPQDLLEDPHVQANGLFDIKLPDQNCSAQLPKLPIEVNGQRPKVAQSPPRVGENTDAILSGLGYSNNDISIWRKQGVIG